MRKEEGETTQMTDTQLRTVTYSRYSSDRQRATSIEDQQRNTHERAKREGWPVVADFADAAVSGADANRPGYKRMQEAAKAGQFNVLLLDDLSRLARDSVEQERTMRRLEYQGIRIISTGDGYDSTSKAKKIQRGMKGLMNEVFLDDLAEKVHRGQKGQAIKGRWNGGRPYGYQLKKILDESQRDQYGEPLRVGTELEIVPKQAHIVREIFERYAAGESCLTIAADLNARGIPSPGSTWKRNVRRCNSWMDTAVRGILASPLYTGRQRWNTCQFLRDPGTGKDRRRERPESEWIANRLPRLEIVSEELFNKAQRRRNAGSNSHAKLKFGNRAKHLLSGLLRCKHCHVNYVMGDNRAYACSSYLGGKACTNSERVRRDEIERVILGPVIEGLLDPARVTRMAKEMEVEWRRQRAAVSARSEAAPRELANLDARINRLHAWLRAGDPDMTDDELQAAIDTAKAKRQQLAAEQPAGRQSARLLQTGPGWP